jgi:biotin carboxyl carrier protein
MVAPLISQANNANNASGAQSSTTAAREQIIAARATVAGTISVIAVRAGQQVTAGQPLATIRTK